jgi:hypothetical protein
MWAQVRYRMFCQSDLCKQLEKISNLVKWLVKLVSFMPNDTAQAKGLNEPLQKILLAYWLTYQPF